MRYGGSNQRDTKWIGRDRKGKEGKGGRDGFSFLFLFLFLQSVFHLSESRRRGKRVKGRKEGERKKGARCGDEDEIKGMMGCS